MFGQFAFNADKGSRAALKRMTEKETLNNKKGYNSLLLESKFEKDLLFFSELGKKVLIQEAAGDIISPDGTNITDISGKDVSIEEAEAETKYNSKIDKDIINSDDEDGVTEINESSEYKEFFNKKLEKYKVESPDKLSDDKKKQFYDEIEKEWTKDDDHVVEESTKPTCSCGKHIEESNELTEFYSKLTVFMENVQKLHEEANIEPKLLTPALEENSFNKLQIKQLNESQIYDIYRNHLDSKIKKEISKPIFEGTFNTEYNDEIKLIMESMITSNIQLSQEDTELMTKYAIFENAIAQVFKEIVMPRDTVEKIKLFENCQDPEYFDMFDQNARTLGNDVDSSATDLASTIAPKMFSDGIGADQSEITPFKGASKIIIIKSAQ